MRCAASSESDAPRVNIRNQIPIRVRMGRARLIGHIGGHAFRGGEPRPFTDQQYGNLRREQLTNFVQYAHPAMADHEDSSDAPSARLRAAVQQRQQAAGLALR